MLLASTTRAAAAGFDTHTWQLAWAISAFLYQRRHWREWANTQHLALDAACRLDEPAAMAKTRRGLANAYAMLCRYEDAHTHLQVALDLYERLGDLVGQAGTHQLLAILHDRQERYTEALRHSQRALDLSRTGGHLKGEALALNNIGWHHAQLGNYRQPSTIASRPSRCTRC